MPTPTKTCTVRSYAWGKGKLTSFLLAFLACNLGQLADGQARPESKLAFDELVFTASTVYSLLQLHSFTGTTLPPPDLEGLYKIYLYKVLAADDRRQFDLATIEFVAQMHNGHTFFWDTWLEQNHNQPLGFYVDAIDGKWVVQNSIVDALRPGDVLDEVDDNAIEAFFLQQRKYISASSSAAQRRNFFLLPYLFPEQFTLTLKDGRRVRIDRATSKRTSEKTVGRWMKPRATAYIRIPSFFDPSLEQQALEHVRQFHNARTLIIDVRNNSGGISPQQFIRVLMDRSYRGWVESAAGDPTSVYVVQQAGKNGKLNPGNSDVMGTPQNTSNPPENATLTHSEKFVAPSPTAFRGRVILLVDGGCVSACEDFAEPFKESGRGTLIGETTQGSSGLPFVYDFKNGMRLKIAVTRYYFPDGSEFEGIGIKPDVEVHTTIDDLKRGRDPVLEKALELAARP